MQSLLVTVTKGTFGGEAEARAWIQGKMWGGDFKASYIDNYLEELCCEAGQWMWWWMAKGYGWSSGQEVIFGFGDFVLFQSHVGDQVFLIQSSYHLWSTLLGPFVPEILDPSGSLSLLSLWNQCKALPLPEHHVCCSRLWARQTLVPSSPSPSECSAMCRHFFLYWKTLRMRPVLESSSNLHLVRSAILSRTL